MSTLVPGEAFLGGRVTLHQGDCRDVLKTLPDNSIDSVVTDPPYALVSIVKRFGANGAKPPLGAIYARSAAGFMGKQWDTGETAFAVEFWAEVYRVLKPGGHVASFSGTRTYHRMAIAIEDAGFEIRDQLAWAYGSGFPKSHDVSKGIDKAAGAEREVVGISSGGASANGFSSGYESSENGAGGTRRGQFKSDDPSVIPVTAPATDAAREWQGWGTALKPAWEPICLARKPLIGTVAANVLKHGTGALNIDGCRVEGEPWKAHSATGLGTIKFFSEGDNPIIDKVPHSQGRWPANLLHDGSDEVVAAFPDAPGQQRATGPEFERNAQVYGKFAGVTPAEPRGDSGSAARFFYTSKADADDRIGSKHPTVKPLDLMQWLCRLITPPGGTILDPFAGTGTTGEAAWREGFNAVLIEREAEYCAEVRSRMHLALEPTKRAAMAAGRGVLRGAEGTPLFGGDMA